MINMFGWFNTAEPACFRRLHYRHSRSLGDLCSPRCMQTVIAEVLSRKYIHFHTDIKVTYSKVKLCPGLPSSGGVPKVLEEQQGEGWRQKKSKGKKIQTLFLVKNPPQLHHMTSQKENATLLLPTPASTPPPPPFHSAGSYQPPLSRTNDQNTSQ